MESPESEGSEQTTEPETQLRHRKLLKCAKETIETGKRSMLGSVRITHSTSYNL